MTHFYVVHPRCLHYLNWLVRLVGMKTLQIGAFEAKTHLSEILEKVRGGQMFVITRRGEPIAELRPLPRQERRPRFGCDKDRVVIGKDFDLPISDMKEYVE